MRFGITPPDCQCPMNFTAFNAYAYHQTCIDNYIDRLVAADDPNDSYTQTSLLYQVGLTPDALTSEDINYIEREVNERL